MQMQILFQQSPTAVVVVLRVVVMMGNSSCSSVGGSQLYQSLEKGQEVLEPMKLELLRASSVALFHL